MVEIALYKHDGAAVIVRGTNIVDVPLGTQLVGRRINKDVHIFKDPITVTSTPVIVDLESIRQVLRKETTACRT